MVKIEDYEEVLESLEGTICFIEGMDEIVSSTLDYYGVSFDDLSTEDKDYISEIITECNCGVIKLVESPCENCGG